MAEISKEYEELVGRIVGNTSTGRTVYLIDPGNKLYKSFDKREHSDASILHYRLAQEFENAARYLPGNAARADAEKSFVEHRKMAEGHLVLAKDNK